MCRIFLSRTSLIQYRLVGTIVYISFCEKNICGLTIFKHGQEVVRHIWIMDIDFENHEINKALQAFATGGFFP